MKYALLLLSVFSVSLLSACSEGTDVPPEDQTQSSSSDSSAVPPPPLNEEDLVTKNVTYTGILEQGGVTIYQEGSHRLMLADGKMVLLEPMEGSPKMLDLYNEKLVRVQGDVKPTVEAGGTLMQVKTIYWIRRETDAQGAEQEMLRVLCGGESDVQCPAGFACALSEEGPGVCEEDSGSLSSSSSSSSDSSESSSTLSTSSSTSSAPSSSTPSSSASSVSAASSISPAPSSSSTSATSSVESGSHAQSVALMSEEDYAPERWTQEYCSAHVGFCVPVHKNWYYKSFGAMSSVLWHVEIGAVNVDQMGDGPLVVELKSGDLAALSLGDGDIRVVGEKAIGYRSFSENRHFEISAPKDLREPVEYVTKSLSLVSGGG